MKEHYDLGVLLVHGIGSQKRGDTLLQFGEPMAESLSDWLGDEAVVVRRTELLHSAAGEPAHADVTILRNGETKRVLVAESWWADTFGPPPWWPFAKWLLWAAPFVVLRATDHRISLIATHNNIRDSQRLMWLWWQFVRVIKNALSVAIALVAVIAVFGLGIVALIPRFRTTFLSAQKLLVGYVGDSYLLLISRGRGDAMVSQVERDLAWLEDDQDLGAVAVVAHSQGAEIARRVLARRQGQPPIDLFVTLGSGIAKLRAVGCLHGQAWKALTAYLLRVAAAALTLAGPLWAVLADGSWWIAVAALLGTAPFAALMIGGARGRLQKIVCARAIPDAALAPLVGKARRWNDFYATSDPVPEGPLPFDDVKPAKPPDWSSTRIANRRSPLLDHTSYWQNAEAFRAPVIAELARLIGWRPAKPTRKLILAAQENRLRSSKRLVAWRYVVGSLAAIVFLLPALGVERGTWGDVADWLGARADSVAEIVRGESGAGLAGYPARHVVAVLVVLLVALALNGTFASTWHSDARRRGRVLLRRMPPPATDLAHHQRRRRRWPRRRTRAGAGESASG